MTLRDRIAEALKAAMKARDAGRLSALRLVNAAIKDRDIALRGEGSAAGAGEDELMGVLGRMVKQRQESARIYDEGGRPELAARERAEIGVIEEFLPRQMTRAEIEAAITAAIAATGAAGIRDMGKVMAALKAGHAGRMDFGAAGARVRARLG
jgi:uncharacterized protein YqeY